MITLFQGIIPALLSHLFVHLNLMKNLTANDYYLFSYGQYAICTAALLLIPAMLSAQIPQNIEVEGEPANGWQYLLWIMVLLFIIAAIFLILRMVNRRKEKDEENN